jgi:hypothetical protein
LQEIAELFLDSAEILTRTSLLSAPGTAGAFEIGTGWQPDGATQLDYVDVDFGPSSRA